MKSITVGSKESHLYVWHNLFKMLSMYSIIKCRYMISVSV